MSEPDIHAHVGLYQGIADDVAEVLPDDWTSVKLTCYMIWATASFEGVCTRESGEQVQIDIPPTLFPKFSELREATYADDQGAWYTAVVSFDEEGNLSVSFDYDNKPHLPPAQDEDYIQDLEKFPRTPDAVPPWLAELTS